MPAGLRRLRRRARAVRVDVAHALERRTVTIGRGAADFFFHRLAELGLGDAERLVRELGELAQRRQILERLQVEELEEVRRRAVENRPARLVFLAEDADRSRSSRSLSVAPLSTPRISSISGRVMGCRYAAIASVSSCARLSFTGPVRSARARTARTARSSGTAIRPRPRRARCLARRYSALSSSITSLDLPRRRGREPRELRRLHRLVAREDERFEQTAQMRLRELRAASTSPSLVRLASSRRRPLGAVARVARMHPRSRMRRLAPRRPRRRHRQRDSSSGMTTFAASTFWQRGPLALERRQRVSFCRSSCASRGWVLALWSRGSRSSPRPAFRVGRELDVQRSERFRLKQARHLQVESSRAARGT